MRISGRLWVGGMVVLCIGSIVAYFVYQAVTKYQAERDFYKENRASFKTIVELAGQAEGKTGGCERLTLPAELADMLRQDKIQNCFNSAGDVTFIWFATPQEGTLYCYIPAWDDNSKEVSFADSAYGTDILAELGEQWFLCNPIN